MRKQERDRLIEFVDNIIFEMMYIRREALRRCPEEPWAQRAMETFRMISEEMGQLWTATGSVKQRELLKDILTRAELLAYLCQIGAPADIIAQQAAHIGSALFLVEDDNSMPALDAHQRLLVTLSFNKKNQKCVKESPDTNEEDREEMMQKLKLLLEEVRECERRHSQDLLYREW